MTFSPARVAIYAQLSSIEEDLRLALIEALNDEPPENVLGERLAASAQNRLDDERGRSAKGTTDLSVLLPYVDLGDLVSIINRYSIRLSPIWIPCLERFNDQLKAILSVRKRIAHVRPLDYNDFVLVEQLASDLLSSHKSLWPSLQSTAEALRDPAGLQLLPQPPTTPTDSGVLNNLPIPDYDDTGFLGRAQQLKTVLQLLRGPYPVISIIGEGGLGKTALALRAAYELLDSDSPPFEAIIFTSSKSSFLTPSEIRQIDQQVKTSLGVLTSASNDLGSNTAGEAAIEDLLFAMTSYRILLVIDNLENVLDETIRQFLDSLPNGSKVLITSRIGLGDYEKKVILPKMAPSEAEGLLRSYARLSGAVQLAKLDRATLAPLCSRMQYNPLWIKWFVSSVLTGASVEDVLRNSDMFLDYCMSNVYNYLSQESRLLVEVLQFSTQPLSLAELNFFQGGEAQETVACLQELRRTNMIDVDITGRGSTCDERYALSALCRMYLQRHHPVKKNRETQLASAKQELDDERGRTERRLRGANPNDPRNFATRSRSDLLVAKRLRDAQNRLEERKYAEALDEIARSRQLAPDYFECLRVEAQVHASLNDFAAADAAFLAAIEMAPEAPSLRYFYASYLMSRERFVDAADHIAAALAIDEDAIYLNEIAARLSIRLLEFKRALECIERCLDALPSRSTAPFEIVNLLIEMRVSHSIFLCETKDRFLCMSELEALRGDSVLFLHSTVRRTMPTLERSLGPALWLRSEDDPGLRARAKNYIEWIGDRDLAGARALRLSWPITEQSREGRVRKIVLEKGYAFLEDGTSDFFFHRNDLVRAEAWDELQVGRTVLFTPAFKDTGPCATSISLE